MTETNPNSTTRPHILGIDFGTSNSAAGLAVAGRPWLVELEPGETTLPTAVFFDSDTKTHRIGRSANRALIEGDNSAAPPVDFLEAPELVRPGDRVVSSGDGGVFPAGLLVGRIAQDPGGRLRVRLAADFERLEYLRVLRHLGSEEIRDPGSLIEPELDGEAKSGVGLSNAGPGDG